MRPRTAHQWVRLESAANPRYRGWRRLLESGRATREGGTTLLEGDHLAEAALAAGVRPRAVIVRDRVGTLRASTREWVDALLSTGADAIELKPSLFDSLSPVERGSGMLVEVPVGARVADGGNGDLIVLDGIQDPGNAGALLRTARAAGITRAWSTPGTTALWSPKAMRAAMGAHFALDIREHLSFDDIRAALSRLTWAAADATAGTSLWEVRFPAGPVGWVFGREGAGLSEEARRAATAASSLRVRIPLAEEVESLNVAAAAAVCLFERERQRIASDPRDQAQ